jgi:hypothetical protein
MFWGQSGAAKDRYLGINSRYVNYEDTRMLVHSSVCTMYIVSFPTLIHEFEAMSRYSVVQGLSASPQQPVLPNLLYL